MLHLCRKRCFHKTRGREQHIVSKVVRAQEVKEPTVPCGVSFPLFFPLVERKEVVEDRTRWQLRRECVSVSANNNLIQES